MRLKHYQEKFLKELKDYLSVWMREIEDIFELKAHLANHINFPKEAREKVTGRLIYHSKTNHSNEVQLS